MYRQRESCEWTFISSAVNCLFFLDDFMNLCAAPRAKFWRRHCLQSTVTRPTFTSVRNYTLAPNRTFFNTP